MEPRCGRQSRDTSLTVTWQGLSLGWWQCTGEWRAKVITKKWTEKQQESVMAWGDSTQMLFCSASLRSFEPWSGPVPNPFGTAEKLVLALKWVAEAHVGGPNEAHSSSAQGQLLAEKGKWSKSLVHRSNALLADRRRRLGTAASGLALETCA